MKFAQLASSPKFHGNLMSTYNTPEKISKGGWGVGKKQQQILKLSNLPTRTHHKTQETRYDMYICICVCIYIYINTCIYIYINTRAQKKELPCNSVSTQHQPNKPWPHRCEVSGKPFCEWFLLGVSSAGLCR